MFFVHGLERVITIHPSFFGPNIHQHLETKLREDVEGTMNGSFYIVCIMDRMQISEGRVVPGTGLAEYTVNYQAIVWRPFRGETLDGVVTSVMSPGIHLDVGPLEVFVSKAMIPSDMKFDANATPPQYTDNEGQIIEKGSHVRIKIKGIRSELDKMMAIGTVKEDYLGTLED